MLKTSTTSFNSSLQNSANENRQNQDAILAKRLQQKDPEAIEEFYNKYTPALYGLICKTLYTQPVCAETLQVVIKQVLHQIGNYDPQKEKLFIWIYRIARNEASKQRNNLVIKQLFSNC